ncbi:MAG: hypothetical protein K2W80_08680 [Burkholderiales bacterium]|nr:hypothetical protein [Burkholderiales bacterium]
MSIVAGFGAEDPVEPRDQTGRDTLAAPVHAQRREKRMKVEIFASAAFALDAAPVFFPLAVELPTASGRYERFHRA